MQKVSLFVLIFCFLATGRSFAESDPLRDLLNANTLKCIVGDGYQTTFVNNKLESEEAKFSSKPEDAVLTFTKLDIKNGSALIVGNNGSSELVLIAGSVGLNFIEKTPIGAVNLYTVFTDQNDKGEFFFATSRHVQLFGSLPSQYYGFCKILD